MGRKSRRWRDISIEIMLSADGETEGEGKQRLKEAGFQQ